MTPETLDVLVALDAKGEPPTEFRIFPKGKVDTRKGAFLFDEEAAGRVMRAAADFGADYPLDYGHAMVAGGVLGHADPAEGHKAAGWFRLAVREGELHAVDVTWTPTAARKLREREYRYVSPAFLATEVDVEGGGKARRVTELLNVALTNVPATKGLSPLVLAATKDAGTSPATEERTMTTILLTTLAAAVGLATSASESDVLARVAEQRDALNELGRATGKERPKEAIGVALAWKEQATRAAVLQTKLDALEADARKADVERRVDEKIDAFLLPPAQRDFAVKLGMKDSEMFTAFLDGLTTRVVAGGLGDQPKPKPTPAGPRDKRIVVPSKEELRFLGITEEDYVKTEQKMLEEGLV